MGSSIIWMPVAELTNPQKTGLLQVYKDHWWLVDIATDSIMFFKTYGSPQCNTNRVIVERRVKPGLKVVLIPWAYVPVDISDYL